MVLGEAYLRGILRPPPADVSALAPNPPHPFQQSFGFYMRQRFMKHHFALVVGYGLTIWAFVSIDKARNNAGKAAYDKAIEEGHSPCELGAAAAVGGAAVGGAGVGTTAAACGAAMVQQQHASLHCAQHNHQLAAAPTIANSRRRRRCVRASRATVTDPLRSCVCCRCCLLCTAVGHH